jgi:hypothetical protein
VRPRAWESNIKTYFRGSYHVNSIELARNVGFCDEHWVP